MTLGNGKSESNMEHHLKMEGGDDPRKQRIRIEKSTT
jgi:hypothetical protein